MSTLDSRNYVATPADIVAIAKAYSEAVDVGGQNRANYLRALVGTTQSELGAKPRLRASSEAEPTLDKEAVRVQMAALDAVHERFYEIVLHAVSGNAEERNRRSNFARSAVSTCRAYVRAGFDITALAAARITKAALAAMVPVRKPRPVGAAVLRRRADKALATLSKIGEALGKVDKGQAVEVLEAAIERLSGRLASLGKAGPVTDAKRALRERRPLKTGVGTFHPIGKAASAH